MLCLHQQVRERYQRTLAKGAGTGKVARMFGLTAARISQLRQELADSWEQFQGELAVNRSRGARPKLSSRQVPGTRPIARIRVSEPSFLWHVL
jgi:hypothetical protein